MRQTSDGGNKSEKGISYMTGVIDIQRRHMTVFNIRFGEKINGRPAKLSDSLRVTSPNQKVVQAFVDRYGGELRKWEEGWEAYLPRTELPIMVLPGQSIQQSWELYRGSVAERRCQGAGGTESLSGKPCICDPDVDRRLADKNQCSITTRLNFLCPEVNVLGAGALVTHGLIAAETLPQAVQVAEQALAAGQMVPAYLRAVQKVGKGKQYVVPQIEIIGFSLNQLMAGELSSGQVSATATASADAKAALPAGGRSGGKGAVVEAEPRTLPVDTASQGSTRSSSPATGPTSTGAAATAQQRSAVKKQAERKSLSSDQIEELILEVTGKYIDEADFSVEHVNKVLDALSKR